MITKTATVVEVENKKAEAFTQLQFGTEAVIKIAIEPLNPSDLPKMLEGLRKINKAYPIVQTRVEESGEHSIVGTSELQLDQVLHDLRTIYADVEIKVSEPFVCIGETVAETSAVPCFSITPNKKNTLAMIAEPVDKGLALRVQSERLNQPTQAQRLSQVLVEEFEWDELTASSVWAFGPQKFNSCSNMILDYTIEEEVDKIKLKQVKPSVI